MSEEPGARSESSGRRLRSWKAAIFIGYVLVSSLCGEIFPFSRFDMYARAHAQETCLSIVVNGRNTDRYKYYDQFDGDYIKPVAAYTMSPWIESSFRAYVLSNPSKSGRAKDAVALEARLCTATVDAGGAGLFCQPFWRGEARPR